MSGEAAWRMFMTKRFRLPDWVRRLLRSTEYARVKNEAEKARREIAASPLYATQWQMVAEALERRAEKLRLLEEATSEPCPGAALLAEHAKALEVVKLVRQYQRRDEPDELTTLRRLLEERARIFHMIFPEDHAKALVRARNEGREEAAARIEADGTHNFWTNAKAIRAKKEPEL